MKGLRELNLLCAIFVLVFTNCNNDNNTGNKTGASFSNIYKNDTLGFSMSYPDGWTVTPSEEVSDFTREGTEATQKLMGNKAIDTWKTFLALEQETGMNRVLGTISRYNPALHGNDYIKSRQTRLEGQAKLFRANPGVTVDYQQVITEIDGALFENARLTITKNGKKVLWVWIYETKFSDNTLWLFSVMSDSEKRLEENIKLIENIKITRNK